MKYPQNIDSGFFKCLISAGWAEDRESLINVFPGILNDFPEDVKKFLNEIWYISFAQDIFCYNDYRDIINLITTYIFGETESKLEDYSDGSYYFNIYGNFVNCRVAHFGYKAGRQILIDEKGRIYIIPDSGDLYYVGAKFYEGLYNLIYNRGERYIALGDGVFMCERTKEKYHIKDI